MAAIDATSRATDPSRQAIATGWDITLGAINVSDLARKALRKRLDDEELDQEIDAYAAAFRTRRP